MKKIAEKAVMARSSLYIKKHLPTLILKTTAYVVYYT